MKMMDISGQDISGFVDNLDITVASYHLGGNNIQLRYIPAESEFRIYKNSSLMKIFASHEVAEAANYYNIA